MTKKRIAETRGLDDSTVQLETKENGDHVLSGYALEWNKQSHLIENRFKEQFAPGAFTDSLKSADVRALFSHDVTRVLGRTKNNTLRLEEDSVGLRFEIDLPNTTLGSDTHKSVLRGDIDGVSFGFLPVTQSWDDSGETVIRTIHSADLLEISPVAFPAYPDSMVSARSADPYGEYKAEKEASEIARLILETYL